MVLNGLEFVSAPLYLLKIFFVGKATEHLRRNWDTPRTLKR